MIAQTHGSESRATILSVQPSNPRDGTWNSIRPTKSKRSFDRLAKESPVGVVFRNSKGTPWTKDTIKCRLSKSSKKVGFRVIAYGTRHSWATNALVDGGVDPISVAHLMGHRDTTMISRVHSHIAKNPDFLRKQAKQAVQ